MGKSVAVVGAAIGAAVLGVVHCGGPAKEGGAGAECFRAEECAAGLVCLDERCTSDLTSVNFRREAGTATVDAGTGTPD
ncbi:MAG TPA: hypothetical protein VK540_08880 [Polyangiaceae bacterium]|nr:hypothetical protein [Polyangiaceae bacterium]